MHTTTTILNPRSSNPDADTGANPWAPAPTSAPARLGRLWRGRTSDPAWVRPALLGLLAGTALLYLWGLGASGWANSFYAAAAQAGSVSWKAFFFGASDAAGSITVDKTPLALWPMALSVRAFGLSSWSILVPQALEGVAAVGVLYATVRRTAGSAGAGLLAGGMLALTPVAVLMFRFDNPDALLVLLQVGAAASTVRAVQATHARADGRTGHPVRWLALAGALVGLGFLAKMLQVFLVLPALVAVYLLAANTTFGRRVLHLLIAFATMLLSAGWWVAIVVLWPTGSRPYIGGSQTNSILELTLGYNGFGRLTGSETGSVGGGVGGGWGATGITRMLSSEVGGQIAWLLPAALILLGAGLWFTRRTLGQSLGTDLLRAGLVLWGGWLLVTGLTFSLMAGIFHAYYTVALAPAIGALVALGATVLWRNRDSYAAPLLLAVTISFSTAFEFALLERTPEYLPWLKWLVALLGFGSALLVVAVRHLPRRVGAGVVAAALVAMLAAPTAYSLSTAGTPHTGSIPSAGPTAAQGMGAAPGGFGGRPPGGIRPGQLTGPSTGQSTRGAAGPSSGGLLEGSRSTPKVTRLLRQAAETYTWAAAAVGSNTAAGYQLASGQPVMAIGGFNGSDPSPTMAEFKQYVADGEIHYFIASGRGGMGPGGGTSSAIASWVESRFTARSVDGVILYDLSGGVR